MSDHSVLVLLVVVESVGGTIKSQNDAHSVLVLAVMESVSSTIKPQKNKMTLTVCLCCLLW